MRIKLLSIMVTDQSKALKFYVDTLGFLEKRNFPAGEFRWLTVVSPEDEDGVELALEPNDNPAGRTFQAGLYKQGIPYTAFQVDDVAREYERLQRLGVVFSKPPTKEYGKVIAIFDDTCGNFIQIEQE